MKSVLFVAAGLLAAAPAWAAPPADLGQRLAEGYARPAMATLDERARAMRQDLQAWCASPGQEGAGKVAAAFGRLAQAWAGVAFLRFGPLVEGNRFERLSFWPDTRGVMPRQVQAALAAADPALLAAGALKSRSVAVQGLPALEYLLYGEPGLLRQAPRDAAGSAYACAMAWPWRAISRSWRASCARPGTGRAPSGASSRRRPGTMSCIAVPRKWRPKP